MEKSDYIIYIDESGDHGLDNLDTDYPLFVLSFCCFKIHNYIHNSVPKLQEFKFKYFGHDQIILHEHHIRKQKDEFAFLRTNADLRIDFLQGISNLVAESEVDIFGVVIDKSRLKRKYAIPDNPYNLGMRFGLERIHQFLLSQNQEKREVYFVFEKRGAKEDDALELEFRRICDQNSKFGYKEIDFNKMKFVPVFADKKSNSCGLQLADLTARPIGIHYLRPEQDNAAYEIIKLKIKSLKTFP